MSLDFTSQPTSDTRDGLGPLHSNEIIIGLALGSPREATHPSLPDEYFGNDRSPPPAARAGFTFDYPDNASQFSQSSPPRRPAATDGLKRSGSKWKNLGALFSKKGPSAPPFDGRPFYMLDQSIPRNEAQNTQDSTPSGRPSTQEPPKKSISLLEAQTRAQTICSAEPARQTGPKAMLRRASTKRLGIRKRARAQTGSSLESNRGAPARMRIEERRCSEEAMEASPWVNTHGHENTRSPAASPWLAKQQRLLEVEIPSVELERYSVMFGDVLKAKSGRAGARSPRRQSQLREIKPAAIEKENYSSGPTLSPLSSNPPLASNPPRPEHSRKDSTSSTGSKSSSSSAKYGLFPPTGPLQKRNTPHKPRPKPSPLSRSVTAPNANVAPLQKPELTASKSQGPEEIMIVIQGTEDLPPPATSSIKSSNPQHRRTSSFDPSDLTHTTNPTNHFDYDNQFEADEASVHIRPSTANPLLQPQPLARDAFPVRKSSMRVPKNTPATTPPLPSSDTLLPAPLSITPKYKPLTSEAVPLSIASSKLKPLIPDGEVSVARQVSITRRQRTVVVPIVPLAARREPMRAKLVDDRPFPVRKDSHQSVEVAVEG